MSLLGGVRGFHLSVPSSLCWQHGGGVHLPSHNFLEHRFTRYINLPDGNQFKTPFY